MEYMLATRWAETIDATHQTYADDVDFFCQLKMLMRAEAEDGEHKIHLKHLKIIKSADKCSHG